MKSLCRSSLFLIPILLVVFPISVLLCGSLGGNLGLYKEASAKVLLSNAIDVRPSTGEKLPTQEKEEESLYARLAKLPIGGLSRRHPDGVYKPAAIINDFVDGLQRNKVLRANPLIKKLTPEFLPGHKFKVTMLFLEYAGGPYKYVGPSLREVHKEFQITDKEWEAAMGELKKSLDKNKVPEREQKDTLKLIESVKKEIVQSGEQKEKA